MNPISHSTNNHVLPIPPHEGSATGVTKVAMPGRLNTTSFLSFWQPTEDERELIANGHPVVLVVFDDKYPPIHLAVAMYREEHERH